MGRKTRSKMRFYTTELVPKKWRDYDADGTIRSGFWHQLNGYWVALESISPTEEKVVQSSHPLINL